MMPKLLTPKQIEWAYEQWCNGHTLSQIAVALHVHEKTVSRSLGDRPRIRPVLTYDFGKEESL